MFVSIVNYVSYSPTSSCWARENFESLQLGSSSWGFQVFMWHRHTRLNFTWRRVRTRKFWPKWWTCLLHGASGWKHRVVTRRAARIRRWFIRPVWLPWSNRIVLTSRRDDSPLSSNQQKWFHPVRSLLLWWNLFRWANQVHLNLSHFNCNNDVNGTSAYKRAHQMWQDPK